MLAHIATSEFLSTYIYSGCSGGDAARFVLFHCFNTYFFCICLALDVFVRALRLGLGVVVLGGIVVVDARTFEVETTVGGPCVVTSVLVGVWVVDVVDVAEVVVVIATAMGVYASHIIIFRPPSIS